MTFRLTYQNQNGVWMEVTPSNPVPVSVVGQHGHLDAICDDIIDKLNDSFDSLSTVLQEISKGVSEPVKVDPVFVNVDAVSEVIVGLQDTIESTSVSNVEAVGIVAKCLYTQFSEQLSVYRGTMVDTMIREGKSLRRLLIIAFSIQALIILSVIITGIINLT